MQPYYEDASGVIYHGDCIDLMKKLSNVNINACITDPPYGLDFHGEAWDSFIPDWIADARAVASLVAFTTCPTSQWDYPKPDWVCCWYREASCARNYTGGFSHWSPILVYGKTKKLNVDSIKLHAIKHSYPKGFQHPSPKPEALMRWLVENFTNEKETVLDPFAGSGTTLVAAKKLNRRYIGIEIEEQYCEMAAKRLIEVEKQCSFQFA